MATPLEKIKCGIETGNWQSVADGYEMLTGEKLNPLVATTDSELILFTAIKGIQINCEEAIQAARAAAKPDTRNKEALQYGDEFADLVAENDLAVSKAGKAKKSGAKPPKKKDQKITSDSSGALTQAIKKDKTGALAVLAEACGHDFRDESEKAFDEADHQSQVEEGLAPDPLDKFRIEHGEGAQDIREDGKKEARKLPFKRGMKNTFVDDGTLALAEREFDKKVLPAQPGDRRPPIKFIKAKCGRCNKTEEINPALAPRRLGQDDEPSSYICNGCIAVAQR